MTNIFRISKWFPVLLLTGVMAMTSVGLARADEALVYSTYTSKENIFNQSVLPYFKTLGERTNGFVKIKDEFYAGALLKGGESIKGTGRGLADVAFYCTGYTPAELALTSMTEMPYITTSGDAHARAMTDLYETYAPLRKEYDALNVEILAFMAPSSTIIGVDKVVKSAGDMKGLKIRAYGQLGEIVQKGGGMVPVSIAFTDIYTSLQTGLINGYVGVPLWLPPTENWLPLTKTIVEPGIGTYFSCGLAMNKDKYNGLPQNMKNTMMEMRRQFPQESIGRVMKGNDFAIAEGKKLGLGFYEFTPTEVAAWKSRVNVNAMEAEWIKTHQEKTQANVAEFFGKFKALVTKYEAQSVYKSSFPSN